VGKGALQRKKKSVDPLQKKKGKRGKRVSKNTVGNPRGQGPAIALGKRQEKAHKKVLTRKKQKKWQPVWVSASSKAAAEKKQNRGKIGRGGGGSQMGKDREKEKEV